MDESILKQACQSLKEGLILTDPSLKLTFINERAQALLATQEDALLGKPITQIDKIFKDSLETLESGKEKREVYGQYKGQQLILHFIPIYTNKGGPSPRSLAVIINDVATHQQLLARTPQDTLLLDAFDVLLNSTNEWYVIVDGNGIICAMSKAYKEFVKVQAPEGLHVTEVIENTRMHQVLVTGNPEITEMQMIQGNKMIASRIPILSGGKVVGAVGKAMFKDIDDLFALYNKVQKNQRKISIFVEPGVEGSTARYTFESISGTSAPTLKAVALGKKASRTDSNVLIVGPSGTGKELFAHAIHHESNRRRGPFVMINCAAIPSELLESELFGYEQGAFTGANKQGRKGRFELAQKGTIFLDEIGDMPMDMQAKLLRVLQSKEIDRVGGDGPIPIDVRVIAATNKPLEQLVEKEKFRTDLYYRLNVMRIDLVPLCDRTEEIPELADDILRKLANRMGLVVHGFTQSALAVLCRYRWPGNIRELENVLERALNLMEDDLYIRETLFPENVWRDGEGDGEGAAAGVEVVDQQVSLLDQTEYLQKIAIKQALVATRGNKKKAAQQLGMSRSGFYKKIKSLGLEDDI